MREESDIGEVGGDDVEVNRDVGSYDVESLQVWVDLCEFITGNDVTRVIGVSWR